MRHIQFVWTFWLQNHAHMLQLRVWLVILICIEVNSIESEDLNPYLRVEMRHKSLI
jgi:hypothetical protein